ncbi:MAG: putative lipid II flippase FtsW [Deltaproteobacteria bacterium]|nr:MAG: putative lipid II flippase FtsW [Deltaproteobacteria bacterium]
MNRRTDFWLISIVGALVTLGLVMVYSASAVVAGESADDPAYFLKRQAAAVAMGIVLCAGTALTPLATMRRWRLAAYVACLFALVLCFVPGIQYRANGAARWLGFGSLHLQPSEFTKVVVLVMLADFLDRWRGYLGDPRVLFRAVLIPAPAVILILPQPDFGTTAILCGLCALMLFVAGMRLRHIGVLVGAGVAVGVPVMLAQQYRINRVTSFLDPWAVSSGEGYHTIQSWIAMHSGGLWGQGLGNSMAKLYFLPEPWTDYIGAVIGEELGLVAVLLVMALFAGLLWRGLTIARHARDPFGMFLAATLTAMIGLNAFFNLAVIMGMVPPKGLVLPFISYGASAMLANLWAVGILLAISAEAEAGPAALGRSPAEGWPQRHEIATARRRAAAAGGH